MAGGAAAAAAADGCGVSGGGGELEAYLAAAVRRSLSLFQYADARFLAERLVASAPTEVSEMGEQGGRG